MWELCCRARCAAALISSSVILLDGRALAQDGTAASGADAPALPSAAPAAPAAPPSTPPAANPAPAGTCFPACRLGFTCNAGSCVSLCNPPCGAGERCDEGSQCISTATERRSSNVEDRTQPDRRDDGEHAARDEPDERDATGRGWRRRGLTVVLRAGFRAFGAGSIESTCESTGTARCDTAGKVDFDDSSPALVGLDVLGHVSPGLRLGAAWWTVPFNAVTPDGDDDPMHVGADTSLMGVLEGLVPAGRNVGIALRAQGGLTLLFPGGDLADQIDAQVESCEGVEVAGCDVATGPFIGYTYGGLVGVVAGNDRVRWRVDAAVQGFDIMTGGVELQNGSQSLNIVERASGVRLWILGGVEL